MRPDLQRFKAGLEAAIVVRDHGIKDLPVDPVAIARRLDISVMPKPLSDRGCSGMLVRVGDSFGIIYAMHIDSAGFRNFSIAHELGHYFLPGHIDAVLATTNSHKSRSGFLSRDRYEMEADHFAAQLLMPKTLFKDAMRVAGEGLQAIEELAETCQTSLTATAIRYTQCTPDPTAIILSTAEKIDFCFMSESLRDTRGLRWIRKGQELPRNTMTHAFNRNGQRVLRAERDADASDLQDWFASDFSLQIEEEVRGLGRYGKTLTILTAPGLSEKLEELQESEALRKSWEPKFLL